MKRRKFEFAVIFALAIFQLSFASTSNFEVYTSEAFAVKLVVTNSLVENVQVSKPGTSDWVNVEILDTEIQQEPVALNTQHFSFYIKDSKKHTYQIDYYYDQFIWIYSIDWPQKQRKGNGMKLYRQEQGKRITLSGFVYNYDPSTKLACFFTDLEMVEHGVARNISPQLTETCFIEKYGYGAILNFEEMPSNKYYKKPIEGLLMDYLGSWKIKDGKSVFYVLEIQPYF